MRRFAPPPQLLPHPAARLPKMCCFRETSQSCQSEEETPVPPVWGGGSRVGCPHFLLRPSAPAPAAAPSPPPHLFPKPPGDVGHPGRGCVIGLELRSTLLAHHHPASLPFMRNLGGATSSPTSCLPSSPCPGGGGPVPTLGLSPGADSRVLGRVCPVRHGSLGCPRWDLGHGHPHNTPRKAPGWLAPRAPTRGCWTELGGAGALRFPPTRARLAHVGARPPGCRRGELP